MDKPFLSFDEQIEKLIKEYNLTINDYEFAKEALFSLSYYDLINGYQSIYRPKGVYVEGTTIEQLVSTHIFNKNIQGVLIKYSTYVENSFKNILSNVIAERYTEHEDNYLNINNYLRKGNYIQRNKLKLLIDKLINTCTSSIDNPTKYYRENKNHIPPWILFRNISFSDAADLFFFMKRSEKEYLFTFIKDLHTDNLEYQEKVNILFSSLTIVRKFRNTIAHNLNFLTYRDTSLNKMTNILFMNTLVSSKEIVKTRSDVWGMVMAIVLLLNNKYIQYNFLTELNTFLNADENLTKLYCEITDIPLDYEERINKYLKTIEF